MTPYYYMVCYLNLPVSFNADRVPVVVSQSVTGLHGHPKRSVAHLELEL